MHHATSLPRSAFRRGLSPLTLVAVATLATFVGVQPATAQGGPRADQSGSVETVPLDTELTAWGRLGGVAADALGTVYVANFHEEVWRIDPDGTVTLLADGFYGSSGNAIDINGDLLQSSFYNGSIYRISRRDGSVSLVTHQVTGGPVAIAVAPDGTLFVASCGDNTIQRVDREGDATTFATSDLFACPNGITFDDQGDLYVVSFNNDHVVRIDPEGHTERFATLEPPGGWSEGAIAAGVRGSAHLVFVRDAFYVTDAKVSVVYKVERDGSFATFSGTPGSAGHDDGALGEATFNVPNGIAAFGQTLYVNTIATGAWRQTRRGSMGLRKILLPR